MSKAEVYSCELVSRTVPWRHAGNIDRCWYEYRVSRDAFRYPSYVLRKHGVGRGLWGGGVVKQWTEKTKAIKCGAFNYSIVTNAHRVTSMADTDIDAIRKQKKAEYAKQYRLKRKLLIQQQASTSSEIELVRKQQSNSKRIPSIFNDESTESFICLRRDLYMSHVNKVQPIRVKMICIAAIRVTYICVV
jgi:hypothetical protein